MAAGGATGAPAVAAVGGAGGADDVVVSAGIVEAAAGATVAAAGAAAIELGVLEAVRSTPSPSSTRRSMTPSAVIASAAKRTATSTGNISRGRRPGLSGHLATSGRSDERVTSCDGCVSEPVVVAVGSRGVVGDGNVGS